MTPTRLAWVLICGAVLVGCGSPHEISGGTAGLLHTSGQPLSDVLVSVYRDDDSDARPCGSAITDHAGRFELIAREPLAPLLLDPGTYRFTVESIGDVYRIWPAKFADPVETPLKQRISSHGETLTFNLPRPRIAR